VIIGELAPMLLDIALELMPVTFNAIPVHFGVFQSGCQSSSAATVGLSKPECLSA
jgi:hypothetical protein